MLQTGGRGTTPATTPRRPSHRLDDTPYWHREPDPLDGFRSRTSLPAQADVVIIGCGLVGASAAYHLANGAAGRVVVIERGDPAGEASGRNAGHFETIPENSIGLYEGLARERYRFLRRCFPELPVQVLRIEAERQASVVLELAIRNRELFRSITEREAIDCDLAQAGWLFLFDDRQQSGIGDEVALAARHGEPVELWSSERIRVEFGFTTSGQGRFLRGDGTYHPVKYVRSLMHRALERGVELFTRLPVLRLEPIDTETEVVHSAMGAIVARRVILATNAFTRELLPELQAIAPRQSQIQVTENAPDRMRGRLVTSDDGPVYFNQPRVGCRGSLAPLLFGGGRDRPVRDAASRRRSRTVHDRLIALRDHYFPELTGATPSAEWVGTMAFTPDQLPAIGPIRPTVVVAMACNGYGGSYATAAGAAAAVIATTGQFPDWLPEDVVSPCRLIDRKPAFLDDQDGLIRIARSLAAQLRSTTGAVAEIAPRGGARAVARAGRCGTWQAVSLPIDALAAMPGLREFEYGDLETLLGAGRLWRLPRASTLIEQGDIADRCFLVLSGHVEVIVDSAAGARRLTTITEGRTVGEIGILDGQSRSASCVARDDCLVLELGREAVERLLGGRSALAVRFLAVTSRSLVTALRRTDRLRLRLARQAEAQGDCGATPLVTPAARTISKASTSLGIASRCLPLP